MTDDLTCYSYIGGTFEFAGVTNAEMDPLEDPPRVAWPANTTNVQPPTYSAGTIPVFDLENQSWHIEPDYRGKFGYDPDGKLVLITRAGNPTTFDPPLTKNPPAPENPDLPTEDELNYAKRTSKVAFFRRCTDAEAAQFMSDLTKASPRLKAIFDSVAYLIPGTEEYPDLRAAVEARVGPDRANALLAPSKD